MLTGAFRERERALENEFFYRVDKQLEAQLRKSLKDQATKDALAQASGLDESLVTELVEQGLSSESLAALGIAPLVMMAWADHEVDAKERQAVLHVAMEQRLDDNELASQLVNQWLDNEPSSELFVAWKHYTRAVYQSLDVTARETMRDEILRHAREVARASGGTLGYGKVCAAEQSLLDEIQQCFELEDSSSAP